MQQVGVRLNGQDDEAINEERAGGVEVGPLPDGPCTGSHQNARSRPYQAEGR